MAIQLPVTGDDVCDRLAFGTARFGRGTLANMESTLERAYDLGIRHFDTSILYDGGAAHAGVGRLIRKHPDDIYISTKIGHFVNTFPDFLRLYRNPETLWGLIHEIYRVLGGRIDLLQIHGADRVDWWEDEPEGARQFIAADADYDYEGSPIAEIIYRACEKGVCSNVGLTGNSAARLSKVVRSMKVDSVLCAYNQDPIFRGSSEHIIPAARERGLTVLLAGVFQAGLYRDTGKLNEQWQDLPGVPERIEAFDRIRDESGLGSIELLLRWMLSVPGADRWILGASSPEQIEQSIGYLRKGPLSADIQGALDGLGVEGLDRMV